MNGEIGELEKEAIHHVIELQKIRECFHVTVVSVVK